MSRNLWHYQDGDKAVGPIDAERIRQRLRDGRMRAGTLVWSEGMPDWARVETTLFAADTPLDSAPVDRPPDDRPPAGLDSSGVAPRQVSSVSAAPAWIIALLPLAFLLLVQLRGTSFIGVALYIGLSIYDRELFKRADRTPSNSCWWMILLGALGAPIYLYHRARRLNE